MLLPGGFGPAPAAASGGKYSAGIVAAVPYMGESDLTNTEDLAGKIVVMGRGKATFASKSLRAQSAGAIAVVIVQNCQVWPYTMTDGKGEAGAELTVPVLMMRQDHGQRLVKLLEEEQGVGEHATTRSEEDGSSGKGGGVSAEISVRKSKPECVICQEQFGVGCTLVTMPCQHNFHEDCLL